MYNDVFIDATEGDGVSFGLNEEAADAVRTASAVYASNIELN